MEYKERPTQKDISAAFSRYDLLVDIFDKLITTLEKKNKNDNRWFIFASKIGKKFLTHTLTLNQIFSEEVYYNNTNSEKMRFIDVGSMFSLLRIQLENYAVFHHLFADNCKMDEKILRFRLWQLDGLKTRQLFKRPNSEIIESIENEKNEIDLIISEIKNSTYFNGLSIEIQNQLIKYSMWRFTDNSLKHKDKNKRKISIEQTITNTGIKTNKIFENWYSHTSTHLHTNFWSVVQNDTLTLEQKITTKYIGIMMSTFAVSHFIIDLCKVQETARVFFEGLSNKDKEIIKSFDSRIKTSH